MKFKSGTRLPRFNQKFGGESSRNFCFAQLCAATARGCWSSREAAEAGLCSELAGFSSNQTA